VDRIIECMAYLIKIYKTMYPENGPGSVDEKREPNAIMPSCGPPSWTGNVMPWPIEEIFALTARLEMQKNDIETMGEDKAYWHVAMLECYMELAEYGLHTGQEVGC